MHDRQALPVSFWNECILISRWLAQFLAFVALHERGCPHRDIENREIRNVTGKGEGTSLKDSRMFALLASQGGSSIIHTFP